VKISLIVAFVIRRGLWNFEHDLLEELTPTKYKDWQPLLSSKKYRQQIQQELIYTLNLRNLVEHVQMYHGDTKGNSEPWEKFFMHQGMSVKYAHTTITNWLLKKGWKLNTLRIRGPASTGKSIFCNMIKAIFACDSISVLESKNNFIFNDCAHKQIIVWEECYIRETELAQEAKKLFAGDNFSFNRKGQEKCRIMKIPCLVTSNKEKFGDGLLSFGDEEALNTRCITFDFKAPWNETMGILKQEDFVAFLLNKY
jgi:hypothetical protein